MDIDIIRLIGCVGIGYFLVSLFLKLRRIVYTHILAKSFGDIRNLPGYGAWAVVTGSTDGIGKGYAKELARRGMNVFLISRNAQKLEATKKEINEISPHADIKTLAFDFGLADLAKFDEIKEALKGLDIGVLVNNVGTGNEYPERFLAHPDAEKTWDRMLKINCLSVVEMTMIILPQMIEKKAGAIINIASAAAFHPTAFLNVYSATKNFVSYFTRGLKTEYADAGVHIQCVYPFFVATNLSKIKRSSFFIPDAASYAKAALNTVGLENETLGCFSHALQGLIYDYVPTFIYDFLSRKILLETRSKYLRRSENKKQE